MTKMDRMLQTHTTYDKDLEEVKRNKAALNIKIRFLFINEKTSMYH